MNNSSAVGALIESTTHADKHQGLNFVIRRQRSGLLGYYQLYLRQHEEGTALIRLMNTRGGSTLDIRYRHRVSDSFVPTEATPLQRGVTVPAREA